MGRRRPRVIPPGAVLLAVCVAAAWPTGAVRPVAVAAQAIAVPEACSRTWPGKEAEIEAYLRTAPIVRMEMVPIGVTRPERAVLADGGPAARFAWKPLPPTMKNGYRESYKAELAAYQLDRLLELHMVPPVVEREIDGATGAAVYWIEHTKPWHKDAPPQG